MAYCVGCQAWPVAGCVEKVIGQKERLPGDLNALVGAVGDRGERVPGEDAEDGVGAVGGVLAAGVRDDERLRQLIDRDNRGSNREQERGGSTRAPCRSGRAWPWSATDLLSRV